MLTNHLAYSELRGNSSICTENSFLPRNIEGIFLEEGGLDAQPPKQ